MRGHAENDPMSNLSKELERRYGVRLQLTEATRELLIFAGSDDQAPRAMIGETRHGFGTSTAFHCIADERRGRFTR